MKKIMGVLGVLLMLAGGKFAAAQEMKAAEPHTIAQVLSQGVGMVEKEFVSAVEAMPEDKFSFVPTGGEFKGVRTFAEQAKHVATVNYHDWSGDSGRKGSGGREQRERSGGDQEQGGDCEVSEGVVRVCGEGDGERE